MNSSTAPSEWCLNRGATALRPASTVACLVARNVASVNPGFRVQTTLVAERVGEPAIAEAVLLLMALHLLPRRST